MEKVQSGCPQMVQSLLTDDCIGRGLPANAGGALINVGPGLAVTGGWGTVADSLAAIKKLVFEEKCLTMADLLQALRDNFEGHEDIQQMLINDAPKFGNDDDYVDDIARDIFHFVSDEGRKHIGIHGNRNVVGTDVSTAHLAFGYFVGATPDGRKGGVPLSDNVGPSDNMDKGGPVPHINSVTKMGLDQQFGTIHNIYFSNVNNDEKKHRMIDLVDAYHRRGGHHLQINCIDKNVLLDAQAKPEKYPTLMVRVAGYAAYFTDLSRKIQDDIISRTNVRI
jgi:formate C-acetyltransferase